MSNNKFSEEYLRYLDTIASAPGFVEKWDQDVKKRLGNISGITKSWDASVKSKLGNNSSPVKEVDERAKKLTNRR